MQLLCKSAYMLAESFVESHSGIVVQFQTHFYAYGLIARLHLAAMTQ